MHRREFSAALLAASSLAAAAPKYRIVDSHVHVWKKDPCFPWAAETKNPPDKDASAEMLLEVMQLRYRWGGLLFERPSGAQTKYRIRYRVVVDAEAPAARLREDVLREIGGKVA